MNTSLITTTNTFPENESTNEIPANFIEIENHLMYIFLFKGYLSDPHGRTSYVNRLLKDVNQISTFLGEKFTHSQLQSLDIDSLKDLILQISKNDNYAGFISENYNYMKDIDTLFYKLKLILESDKDIALNIHSNERDEFICLLKNVFKIYRFDWKNILGDLKTTLIQDIQLIKGNTDLTLNESRMLECIVTNIDTNEDELRERKKSFEPENELHIIRDALIKLISSNKETHEEITRIYSRFAVKDVCTALGFYCEQISSFFYPNLLLDKLKSSTKIELKALLEDAFILHNGYLHQLDIDVIKLIINSYSN